MTATDTPTRSDVPVADTWDLTLLFPDEAAWESALGEFESLIDGFESFRGKLGESPETIANCLAYDCRVDQLSEKVGVYASLKTSEDQGDSHYQGYMARYYNIATKAGKAASFIRPEILAIPQSKLDSFLRSPALAPFQLIVERIIRFRKHTMSVAEEKLLAMQGEMSQTASKVFRQLNDADLRFGKLKNEKGLEVDLTNASFSSFLISPSREVRQKAFHQYYSQFASHENTLAATLAGSIQTDVYYARARNYASARESSLFADNVPLSVYDNLIGAVRNHLPSVHRYFDLRRRKMGLNEIRHYDTYVPILADQEVNYTWDQATEMVIESLKPLGAEYCSTLEQGLRGRWCDRYPNQGKRSGAFSSGTYRGVPYILMNYKPTVLNDVVT